MKLIFATGNSHKLREAQEILGPGFELVSAAQAGVTEEIPETGETLMENSVMKAEYLYRRTGMNCMADDTGLEVDALNGAPGVHSARYATDGHDFAANVAKLLAELDRVGASDPQSRKARFKTVVTLIIGGEKHYFTGTMEGWIASEPAGCGGFGYDPVFVSELYPEQTVSELSEQTKNSISHRGNAMRAMASWLKSQNF